MNPQFLNIIWAERQCEEKSRNGKQLGDPNYDKVRFPINHFTCSLYKNRNIIIEVTESAAMVFFYRIQGKKEGVDFDHQKSWNPNDLAAEGWALPKKCDSQCNLCCTYFIGAKPI